MDTRTGVWVIDASAIINIKKVVPGNRQWKFFRHLEKMVECGSLVFPKQVKDEVTGMAHPDAPGVWADGVYPIITLPKEVEPWAIQQVMQSEANAVVDPTKTREDGDPYLIALALQLAHEGYSCCVVTDDLKDNPLRIAVSSACDILDIQWCSLSDFLDGCGMDLTVQ